MTTSRKFLELVLSGEEVTPAHLDILVATKVKEDEYIEYKSGALFQDKSNKELSRMIRQYMSGFANSEGGVFIIGVKQEESRPTEVDGCRAHRIKGDLAHWAAECVKDIGARFSPLPKFRLVEHPLGKVLVGAVGRSYNLVPVYEDGREIYYLRMGEHMQAASDFLVADLKLGRRARPNLEVRNVYLQELRRVSSRPDHFQVFLQFDIVVEVENAGLVWAEASQYGLIVVDRFEPTRLPQKVPTSLSEHIDLQSVQFQVGQLCISGMPIVLRGGSKLERPFDTGIIQHTFEVPLALYSQVHPFVWKAALYLLAKDCPPVWYQIDLRIDSALNGLLRSPYQALERLPDDWEGFSIRRVIGERPVVGWISLA